MDRKSLKETSSRLQNLRPSLRKWQSPLTPLLTWKGIKKLHRGSRFWEPVGVICTYQAYWDLGGLGMAGCNLINDFQIWDQACRCPNNLCRKWPRSYWDLCQLIKVSKSFINTSEPDSETAKSSVRYIGTDPAWLDLGALEKAETNNFIIASHSDIYTTSSGNLCMKLRYLCLMSQQNRCWQTSSHKWYGQTY